MWRIFYGTVAKKNSSFLLYLDEPHDSSLWQLLLQFYVTPRPSWNIFYHFIRNEENFWNGDMRKPWCYNVTMLYISWNMPYVCRWYPFGELYLQWPEKFPLTKSLENFAPETDRTNLFKDCNTFPLTIFTQSIFSLESGVIFFRIWEIFVEEKSEFITSNYNYRVWRPEK